MHGTYGTIIAIGWVMFWLYWLISAVSAKKSNHFTRGRWGWLRVIIFVGTFLTVRLANRRGSAWSYNSLTLHHGAIEAIGLFFFVAGLLLALWARLHIGKNWGMPMTQKAEPELVTSGPYAFVRHPIYTGVLTAILGTALTVSLFWLFIFVLVATYFVLSAANEETYLAQTFPKTYASYKRKTKMLLPYLF